MELNKIHNMDCFEGMANMNDKSVDHVFTSPPYNRKRNDKYSHYEDTLVDYKTFLTKTIDESLRISKGFVFFNIQKNYYNKKEVFELIGMYSDKMIEIIIWNKSNPMPAAGLAITNAYEFILVLSDTKTSLKSNSTYTKNAFTTNAFTNNKYTTVHKAVMHPQACDFVLDNFTKENEIILDPFMGVGTTAIACANKKRSFIGFELSGEYCDIANKRIMEQPIQAESEIK